MYIERELDVYSSILGVDLYCESYLTCTKLDVYEYSERGFGIKVNLACAFCRVQTKGIDRLDLGLD